MPGTYSKESDFIQPSIRYIGKGKKREYILLEDYTFEYYQAGTLSRRIIKAGYDTDLASVPPLFGVSEDLGFSPYGPVEAAALLHDRGYQKRGVFPPGEYQLFLHGEWVDSDSKWSRTDCDQLYRKMAILGGLDPARAEVEYKALRWFGGLNDGFKWYFS